MMHRVAYRTLVGRRRSPIVLNFMVNVSGQDPTGDPSKFQAGIRWVELRRNVRHRRRDGRRPGHLRAGLGHGATRPRHLDGVGGAGPPGNIAGFSASVRPIPARARQTRSGFPSILYAGRLAGDPAGHARAGRGDSSGGQPGRSRSSADRWGDYSAMSVDPADECTFWYTNEYYAISSSSKLADAGRQLQVPGAHAPVKAVIQGTVTACASSAALSGVVLTTPDGYMRASDAAGAYAIRVAPGTYTVTATRAGYATDTKPFTIAAGNADGGFLPDAGAGPRRRAESLRRRSVRRSTAPSIRAKRSPEPLPRDAGAAGTGEPRRHAAVLRAASQSERPAGLRRAPGRRRTGVPPIHVLRAAGACGATLVATLALTNDGSPAGSATFDIHARRAGRPARRRASTA